jgi:hypothetical protein
MGWWKSILSFLQGPSEVFVPWVSFRSPEGSLCDGPLLRVGVGRRELLTWTDRDAASGAAQEVVQKTGGSYEVKVCSRQQVEGHCRAFSTRSSRVVALILKP